MTRYLNISKLPQVIEVIYHDDELISLAKISHKFINTIDNLRQIDHVYWECTPTVLCTCIIIGMSKFS